jgi:hypothetical protein
LVIKGLEIVVSVMNELSMELALPRPLPATLHELPINTDDPDYSAFKAL